MTTRDFYLRIADALAGCQLVEQELKLYISEALELVRKCVATKLPFTMSGRDYEDASLERLIDVFKKISDNPQIVADLSKFKNERNFLSHRGISHCLDRDGEVDLAAAADFESRLSAIQPEAQRLREAIANEAHKFHIHLFLGRV